MTRKKAPWLAGCVLALGLAPTAASAGGTQAIATPPAQSGGLPACHYAPADDGRPIRVPESDSGAASIAGPPRRTVKLAGSASGLPERGGDVGGGEAGRTEDRASKAAVVAGGLVLAAAIATTATRKAGRKRG